MPRTIRKRKSPPRRIVQQKAFPVLKSLSYFPPERDPDIEYTKDKRRQIMGEAKTLVEGTPKPAMPPPMPAEKRKPSPGGDTSIIEQLETTIDDLDKAISIKQADLLSESRGSRPENHYKLGILRATDS